MAEEQEGSLIPEIAGKQGVVKVVDQDAAQEQANATRKTLSDVDSVADEGAVSLVDIWDRIVGFRDTNEHVRTNIQQIQHMFQEAYEEHQRQKIGDNTRLKKMLKEAKTNPAAADEYALELRRVNSERKSDRAQLLKIADTVTSLAKEYRSCSMQRAMFIHIALIQQFTLMITASIQRHVKDQHSIRAIIGDIKTAKGMCFPSQSGE